MERTPDSKSVKRGRSIETETPINRQRLISPVQAVGTPAGEVSYSSSFEDNERGERTDWIQSMEEDERLINVSDVQPHCHGVEDDECVVEQNRSEKRNSYVKVNETNHINGRMDIGGKDYRNQSNVSMSGIQNLEQPTHQHLPYLVKMMGELFHKALAEAIEPLKEEIRTLTNKMESFETKILQKEVPVVVNSQPMNPPIWPRIPSKLNIPHIPKVTDREQAFNLARRCVGLYPISHEDLIRNTNKMDECTDTNLREQRGGAFTIRDYLCTVMKMDEKEAERLNIIRVFKHKQPGQSNNNVLFVEFTNESDLKKIRSMVANMENDGDFEPKMINYIPKLIQKEYDIVTQKAYKGRSMDPRNASKIWITDKFELRLRPKGDFTPWNKIPQTEFEDPPKQTGTIPKSKPTATQQTRSKPDFSNTNNPNFQQIGKVNVRKSSWEGPNLLPSQQATPTSSSNIYSMLGEELKIHP